MYSSRSAGQVAVEHACSGLSSAQIERVFARCFARSERTCLVGGAEEPVYRPASTQEDWHRILYRLDYAASALHEVAHWCIAGSERRQLLDYGYWYEPEGRDTRAQRAFAAVEARPQALEWVFSQAARRSFRLSLDNLDATPCPAQTRRFAEAVLAAAQRLQLGGLPVRAACFVAALSARAQGPALAQMQFFLPALVGSDELSA